MAGSPAGAADPRVLASGIDVLGIDVSAESLQAASVLCLRRDMARLIEAPAKFIAGATRAYCKRLTFPHFPVYKAPLPAFSILHHVT